VLEWIFHFFVRLVLCVLEVILILSLQGHILIRNAHSPEMFPSGVVSFLVLVTAPRW
jgi:hypothetical protein